MHILECERLGANRFVRGSADHYASELSADELPRAKDATFTHILSAIMLYWQTVCTRPPLPRKH